MASIHCLAVEFDDVAVDSRIVEGGAVDFLHFQNVSVEPSHTFQVVNGDENMMEVKIVHGRPTGEGSTRQTTCSTDYLVGILFSHMHKEIERKHLVKELPADLESFPHTEIAQGHLAIDPHGSEVRLRRDGDKCLLTAKARLEKGIRIEREIRLSKQQFEELWPATEERRLYKTRYRIPWAGFVIEIDIYRGRNAGLTVAEVEFPDEASRTRFQSPAWFGEDISDVAKYSNQSLAGEE